MNTEHLLDAIGLLDDDLIQEAEEYTTSRRPFNYRRWGTLAASFVVVLLLGYGLTHLKMANYNTSGSIGDQAGGSAPCGTASGSAFPEAPEWAEPTTPGATNEDANAYPDETDYPAAIMVDGVLYWSTGEAVPGEVDERLIQTVTAYINTVPEMDGQTNFSQDLSARYAMTDLGLVVLMDGEWILFDAVPPWER